MGRMKFPIRGCSAILSIDVGTTSICALAMRTDTTEVLCSYSAANTAGVANLPAGWHEQSPEIILGLVHQLLANVAKDKSLQGIPVVSIVVTGQMHGVLLVDKEIKPQTNLLTWRDARILDTSKPGNLASARAALSKTIGANGDNTLGCELHPGYGGATLHWLSMQGRLGTNVTALAIADFVVASLAGRSVTDPTHAASFGLLDLVKNDWHPQVMARLEIPPAILPPILPSGQQIGAILPDVADKAGLPRTTGICASVGDNQASIYALTRGNLDTGVVNLGTGGQISLPCRTYQYAPPLETRPMPGGHFINVGASLCGGWAYAYLRSFFEGVLRAFGAEAPSEGEMYRTMNALAMATPVGCAGLVADTRFLGMRGDPDQHGAIREIDCNNFTPANLARAVLEGMVRELAAMTADQRSRDITSLAATGNAVRLNSLIHTIIQEQFRLPCRIAKGEEDAALGAALLALHKMKG
jgi:sedoheptulokinase